MRAMPASSGRWLFLAIFAAAMAAAAAWLDARYGWISTAFDAVAHQFYEVPLLARIRRSSQLMLVRWHLAIGSALLVVSLLLAPWSGRHGRIWLAIFGLGYAIRAVVWICGGNLPLVPGDSCHYLEVSTSVLRGEGPVKHYVESFFRDYPPIRDGQGVLDDWATPLDAYVRATAFRIAGLGPERLAGRADRRRQGVQLHRQPAGPSRALPLCSAAVRSPGSRSGRMAALAVLPVHAIYAGFILRESLVALLSILAVWTLTEVWHAAPQSRSVWIWAVAAGLCGGLAVLARTTGLALLAAAGLFAVAAHGRRRAGALLLWAGVAALVCLPWAWETSRNMERLLFDDAAFLNITFHGRSTITTRETRCRRSSTRGRTCPRSSA